MIYPGDGFLGTCHGMRHAQDMDMICRWAGDLEQKYWFDIYTCMNLHQIIFSPRIDR